MNNLMHGPVRWRASLGKALRSRLGANILSLYAVQGLNYLLPLLVLPYLLRVLGPQSYGSIVFAQSLMGYAVVLTDFGFNFTATRAVSLARDRPDELARIFWSTMGAKALLLVISAAVIVPTVSLVPALKEQSSVVAVCGLLVLGSVAFPQWYFQGLERMRIVAVIHVVTKLIAFISTFVFVHSTGDQLAAGAILSMPQVIAAALCVVAISRIAPVGWHRPSMKDILRTLASSWHLFVSNAAGSLYLNSNAFFLGLLSGDYAVALYSLANKVTLTLFNLTSPVAQAVFPRASIVFRRSPQEARAFVRRLTIFLLPAAGVLSIALCIFAPLIVRLLAGDGYADAVPVLRVMSILPLLLTGATVLAQIVMINVGLSKSLSRIYLAVGVLNLVLLPLMVSRHGALGAAMLLVLAETLGPVLMIRAIRRAGFFPAAGQVGP